MCNRDLGRRGVTWQCLLGPLVTLMRQQKRNAIGVYLTGLGIVDCMNIRRESVVENSSSPHTGHL